MITKSDISLVLPSRDNLKYLKWAYASIRKNGGDDVKICAADDASTDGTSEWMKKTAEKDPNFLYIVNDSGQRLGHTILYDRIINELAYTKVVGIVHADMYLCPGALEAVCDEIKPKTVVSLTRIEPPLHPDGPEKLLRDFGIEPEDFNEKKFLKWFKGYMKDYSGKNTTEGIFAPWFIYKDDFQRIGGHDELYAPQSKEDSDIFNRFHLAGYSFTQTWHGYVYHMTCRGSRFNPTLTEVGKESPEWLAQNARSTRNFIRKWGHFVKHDHYMKPIVPPKYDLGFVLENPTPELLRMLEPWCSNVYVDPQHKQMVDEYIKSEQHNTKYDLSKRIGFIDATPFPNDIRVSFNVRQVNQHMMNLIMQFPEILENSELSAGKFTLEIFDFEIYRVKTHQNELITIDNSIYSK